MEVDGLLEDMSFDAELDGFFAGTVGTVNLQPHPMTLGSSLEDGLPPQKPHAESGWQQPEQQGGGVAAAAATAASAVASALLAGKLAVVFGDAMGTVANVAVPTSLQPVKERAGQLLRQVQPWRQFLLPLSVPSANEGCSRLTANIYHFQTNYAVLFVLQLVLAIVLQPSALICIVVTVVIWIMFLRKNTDPEWKPEIGGMVLGPMQRWLLLAATTAITLLCVAGSTIFNAALFYVAVAIAHGIAHDPSAKSIPGPPNDAFAL